MTNFDKFERYILAFLEEAGQDNIVALLNTVRQAYPTTGLNDYRTALIRLINQRFIALARAFDEASRHWITLSAPESASLVTELHSSVQWSNADQLWKWSSTSPRIEVLLTDTGVKAARDILSRDGWPSSWTTTPE